MSCSGKKNNRRKLRGGSPASDLVNQALLGPPVKDDYVTSPRIRDGPNADKFGIKYGGSDESDLVMKQLGDIATTNKYPLGYNVKANMNSLKLYQPTGGSRKKKNKKNKNKNKKSSKVRNMSKINNNSGSTSNKYKKSNKSRNSKNSKKNNNNKYKKNMKGGGSDWMSSQYSLGSYNGPEMSDGDVKQFSNSEAGSRADYMNPPNLGTAGSGYPMGSLEGANVRMTGAPLV
jgi:hypothetical protein